MAKNRQTILDKTQKQSHNTIHEEEYEDDDFIESVEDPSKSKGSKVTGGTTSGILVEEANNHNFDQDFTATDPHSSSKYDKSQGKSEITRKSLVVDGEEALDERSDINDAEEVEDDYVDDFEPASEQQESDNDFVKASMSQSSRLPPLNANNPAGGMTAQRS